MDKFSYLSNGDVEAIESLYNQYKSNPDNVDFGWRKFFEGFELSQTVFAAKPSANGSSAAVPENFQKEFKVINLINDYRSRGHLFTKTNPVRTRRQYSPTLEIENYGFTPADLDTPFQAGSELGLGTTTLRNIVAHLEDTYCKSVGVEYMYIRNPKVVQWLKQKIEPNRNQPNFSVAEKKEILRKISQAVVFENFLHKKFVGQKRFSLEGGEALIPALNAVVEKGATLGIKEFVVGMAHRGRLNVLANIFNKTYRDIFTEFEGKEYEDNLFDGDVKYHLGFTSSVKTDFGPMVNLTLSPNPSHLEAVDPVVEGIVRAKIDQYLKDEKLICPILIHGDASIAGQGIVYEVVQMAQLKGYRTGGTIHIVINNQIGFTTNYVDGRSSTYCTDVGKVTLSPVFHVNGDDVEAVVHTINLAMEFRQQFHQDVFIDLLCYRKYGHNEGDEPRFTQPLLYKIISKHPNPREIYLKKLEQEGVFSKQKMAEMDDDFQQMLQNLLDESKEVQKATISNFLSKTWEGVAYSTPEDFEASPDTGVELSLLKTLGEKVTTLPTDKKLFKKIEKLFEDRKRMLEEGTNLDWAMGETLAYASLLNQGHLVRISGQDVERGTFSHRHAVITLEDSEEKYVPLANLGPNQGEFHIYNSLLSEYGVLGFDYGYAMASPHALTIWEAQFGDFNNGAQIILDQFLSAAEDKWNTMNGLVMYLPHGYEGQGSEHSSARLERFLTLCAEYNMVVANCTTPANLFHILRRQLTWKFRKPLVIFTPKSLLRHPLCVSSLEDMAQGKFQEVIDDARAKVDKVKTIVFVSGKFYYDILEAQNEQGIDDFALVRIEQLYPLPQKQLDAIIAKYKNATQYIWAQEEPRNMGAWSYMLRNFRGIKLNVIGLYDSASPATGSSQRHKQRHQRIINQVLNKDINPKRY